MFDILCQISVAFAPTPIKLHILQHQYCSLNLRLFYSCDQRITFHFPLHCKCPIVGLLQFLNPYILGVWNFTLPSEVVSLASKQVLSTTDTSIDGGHSFGVAEVPASVSTAKTSLWMLTRLATARRTWRLWTRAPTSARAGASARTPARASAYRRLGYRSRRLSGDDPDDDRDNVILCRRGLGDWPWL